MHSRWKAALIFSAALLLSGSSTLFGREVGRVVYSGTELFTPVELERGSHLKKGVMFADSLIYMEISRLDSLYFSTGRLSAGISVDTSTYDEAFEVKFDISEGPRAVIGDLKLKGDKLADAGEILVDLGVGVGEPFSPAALADALFKILEKYNDSGYPFAQVWLTAFEFDEDVNEVVMSISIFEGEEAVVSRVVFEGLSKTDSAVALRTSRLSPGAVYSENALSQAVDYLEASGLFRSVNESTVRRKGDGMVDISIEVEEAVRNSFFQGAIGVSRKDDGDYVTSGSVDLGLSNIAGTGRNASFSWLNDGRDYSDMEIGYTEPFLFSLPVHLDGEIKQTVQDTQYVKHSVGMFLRIPLGPDFSILTGGAVDRNVPGQGELLKSMRQRYRLGFIKEIGSIFHFELVADGAYKRDYLRGDRVESAGQFITRIESGLDLPTFRNQSLWLRFVFEGVFPSEDVSAAERIPLGGAKTLRGYRENQFRGERVIFSSFEYRFGRSGHLFVFDDIGSYFRIGRGWTVKNGLGFGLRSPSPLGTVVLSFGVGDRLSLEGSRVHVMLQERF